MQIETVMAFIAGTSRDFEGEVGAAFECARYERVIQGLGTVQRMFALMTTID